MYAQTSAIERKNDVPEHPCDGPFPTDLRG